MADPTKAWHKAFDSGSKEMQNRLKKVHANNPKFQEFLKSRGAESGERSVKQASTSLSKATSSKVAAQKIADMRYKKALQASSERVREMGRRRREGGEGLGGGLDSNKDIVAHVKRYGSIKAGRLGEEKMNEVTKKEAEAVLGGPLKQKPKMPPGKQPAGYRYVRGLARKAMKAGMKKDEYDSPARKAMERELQYNPKYRMEEVEQIDEVNEKQIKKDLDSGMSHDAVIGKHANKKLTNTDAIRKVINQHAWNKRMKKEEVEQVVEQNDAMEKKEMAQTQLHFIGYAAKEILEFIDMGGEIEEWYQNKLSKVQSEVESLHSYIEGEKRRTGMVKEEEQIDEKAPPGAKYERMVKHIKKGYAKGGLTDKERSIAYATAWKAHNKANEEVEQTDEAIRVTMANRQLPPKSKRRVAGGAPTKSDMRRDVAAAAAKEKRSMYGHKGLPMGGINALNVLMPKNVKKGQETWFVGAKKTNEEVEQIDELKKSTLASYVNKAAHQVRAKSGIAASFETQGTRKRNPENKSAYMDVAKDFRQGAKKRLTGIEKATAKLSKEEVEQVEEKYENNPLHSMPRPNKAVGLKPSQLAKKPVTAEVAEGSVPTTPKEKELAKHHGDPNRITFGDVIKARLKSVAAKKMGK